MPNVIETAWLDQFPLATIPTYDDEEWDRSRKARVADASDEGERLEQLKALGYIQ